MAMSSKAPEGISEYIAACPAAVRPTLIDAGPRDNLKFPLDQPFPHALLKRIRRHRVKQDRIKKALASG